MSIFCLVKAGYGSFKELSSLDTPEILDMIEMENISNDIERYYLENGNSK